MLVVNEIDASTTPFRTGIPGKGLNSLNDAQAIRLVPAASSSFPAELLINSLYSATPF
jgi:hypothetical protein